jgi:hypothetical protein
MPKEETQFAKGKSGNPKGRPVETQDHKEAKALFKAMTKEAAEKLAYIMENGTERNQLTAATTILERAWGKPTQALTGGDDKDSRPLFVINTSAKVTDG